MKRFTNRNKNGEAELTLKSNNENDGIWTISDCKDGNYKITGTAIERFAEYEEMEERCVLLMLGRTVYIPKTHYYKGLTRYYEPNIIQATICEAKISYNEDSEKFFSEFKVKTKNEIIKFSSDDIGETIFLIEEEAETKLKEMEMKIND